MPTKRPRLNVSFPEQRFYDTVLRDATVNRRSMSDQIVWILDQYYSERKKEADLFTATPLREAKHSDVPVFETPPQHSAERVLKIRANLDREKS